MEADACPHCGYPVQRILEDRKRRRAEAERKISERRNARAEQRRAKKDQRRRSRAWAPALLAVGLFGLCTVLLSDSEPPTEATPATSSGETEEPNSVTAPANAVYAKTTVNIREGPGVEYRVIDEAVPGEELRYLYRRGEWYKLERYSANTGTWAGWVHESVVASSNEGLPRPEVSRRARASTADRRSLLACHQPN